MKFTKQEIALAKKLHELGVKKEIKCGDWYAFYYSNGEIELFVHTSRKTYKSSLKFYKDCSPKVDAIIPLWTIADCLEWLRERGWRYILHYWDIKEYHFGYGRDDTREWHDVESSKTPLEAILKCMVEVLAGRE